MAEVIGTLEAFKALIETRGIYKRLGVDKSTVASWKVRLKKGESLTLDKMEEILLKGGASVVQEKVWEI